VSPGVLRFGNLRLTYRGHAFPVINGAEGTIVPGEAVALTGRSGSGKSTLLKALNGLIPWLFPARLEGEIRLGGEVLGDLDPGQRAHLMATCLDRPESQLFLPTPRREIEAALVLYGEDRWPRELINRLEIEDLLDRRILELSSGERRRVSLAVALCAGNRPILLDEPSSHLDPPGAAALSDLLARSLDGGTSVLAAEHSAWRLNSVFSRCLDLDDGTLRERGRPRCPKIPGPSHGPGDQIIFRAENLAAEVGGRTLFGGVDLELLEGEILLLSGMNGVGKSTLARILTKNARPAGGSLDFRRSGRPLLMLPDADLELFSPTVRQEVRRKGMTEEETAKILRRHGLESLSGRTPWSLSRGERQRLVHAALDGMRPRLMVIDEPAPGLDADSLMDFIHLLHRRAERGRAYIIITHRLELVSAAHRHLVLTPGGLEVSGG